MNCGYTGDSEQILVLRELTGLTRIQMIITQYGKCWDWTGRNAGAKRNLMEGPGNVF